MGEIFNPAWSPDGRFVVFSGAVGGLMDLFVIEVETGERRRLTNDAYADLQPAWSPDGTRIAFVTDRFTTDLSTLKWGGYQLALIDPETRAIEPVPGFAEAKNINPQWSADGSSLYFISDANGISNIYRVTLADGEFRQITNLVTGVSGITELSPAISLAARGKPLMFSAYEGDRYTIYAIDSETVLAGGTPSPPLTDVSPAVLPPADRPVGDVMALVRNPDLGLPGVGEEFETTNYSAGLSLDYIAPPQLVAGADQFGTFVGGGTALFWSDILGEHTLATLLQINGSFQDIAAVVGYSNRQSRWSWGAVGGQIPIVTRGFILTIDPLGNFVQSEIVLRQINREITGLLAYPLSRAQRIEFSARYQNITFDNELEIRTFTPGGTPIGEDKIDFPKCSEQLTQFCEPDALNIGSASAALVYDNTIFGYTGPILGQRYRLEAAPVFGSLNYVGALADYRRYFRPVGQLTLASRFLHFGRWGNGGEEGQLFNGQLVPTLTPIFIGYQQLMRGYDAGSFDFDECQPIGSESFVGDEFSSCPVFDQLFGSRMLIGNFELRAPFPQVLGVGTPAGLPPLTLAVFFDAGVAWWSEGAALQIGGNRDPWNPVTSYGVAARLNLFGIALLEFDFVHPNNRPEKGWVWQFGFSPGF